MANYGNYSKKISLNPLSLEQVLIGLLSVKNTDKKKKSSKKHLKTNNKSRINATK
jgi:hypothetical protein